MWEIKIAQSKETRQILKQKEQSLGIYELLYKTEGKHPLSCALELTKD